VRTSIVLPLLLSLGFALACSGGPAPESPPPAPPPPPATPTTPTPPPASPTVPATPTAPVAPVAAQPAGPFLCCDEPRVDRIVEEYLDLQRALTNDDQRKASGETSAVRGVILSAQKSELNAEDKKTVDALLVDIDAAKSAGDIEGQRKAFKTLSAGVVELAKRHKGGKQSVQEAWCPMAEAGWLQSEPTLANPYYGSKMLTCGSFK
jgi:hypothetical protein